MIDIKGSIGRIEMAISDIKTKFYRDVEKKGKKSNAIRDLIKEIEDQKKIVLKYSRLYNKSKEFLTTRQIKEVEQ